MKKSISFATFNAELNTDVCDAYNNAELTLTLNLGFTQINPAAGADTGTYHDYGNAAKPARKIIKWTPGSWAEWKTNFVTTAAAYWNGKFWLVNDAGVFTYMIGTETYVPNVYCKMKIVAQEGGAVGTHHSISVVRLDPTEKWFGSHSTLYDSKDTNWNKKGTDSHGKKIMQQAHVHEVGHLLGLGHVDIGKAHCPAASDTNLGPCYGVSDEDKNSVMGQGMKLHIEHAEPWRTAIRSFALEDVLMANSSPTNLLMPTSRLFAFSSSLLAAWPAKLSRHYPRTLAEARLGLNVTSRVARAAA